ncbi:UNVERIFIED_CONTAM: hypothetical protein Slati_1487600 [Sesamum latifolium]|uniref:Uncharacterized protein n=1 Tax=Sesamum latifolium TaxID=2727402 RepID=A0AAW2X928_9LAMI
MSRKLFSYDVFAERDASLGQAVSPELLAGKVPPFPSSGIAKCQGADVQLLLYLQSQQG